MKDRIFTQDVSKQFEFDAQVASVFDDMLERSIPHYKEVLGLIVDFCSYNLQTPHRESQHLDVTESAESHTNNSQTSQDSQSLDSSNSPLIYDLGSSTGTTLLALSQTLPLHTRFIGIDNSQAMVDKASLKAQAYEAKIDFVCADLLEYNFLPSQVVIANYILQFIRPMQRAALLQKIYHSLRNGGILIISEKMISHHRILDHQMIERYLRYKSEQGGYSQTEISKKREALENVLVPFSLEENMALLKQTGFEGIEVLFKWVNFGTIIAKK
ncbi:carboxy-S-adenosyl-L-methionine synthase CmoA [Helicobacter sp. MIT 05-5293]|uniref:carboxy-S-adenosyl-L-methionine synthase CmoA n=1 Tax=Helicobacter sp. MIT 05-5293 TaxID=1548149 RepID=UPI00051DFFDF|nr:carboxy-S-adenosyl-L-methionine synthase CmoA [Helicobacter sp. MIT 05-5293]TLD82168.1 carboxy-S-adenosyl-L-methionine synthase CmoA [Helicobacter sp. MIT 05-5293]